MALIDKVKTALRVTTSDADLTQELNDLIESAKQDLGIAGVVLPEELTAIAETAIKTYCKLNFGIPEDADRLKRSYDEQKAQLSNATGYTNWEVNNV